MKIILSPSKTKVLQGVGTKTLADEALTKRIAAHLAAMPVTALGKALKLDAEKAAQWHDFYEGFEMVPTGAAALSYAGLAFKNLNWAGLSPEAAAFGEDHVCILSALYGPLTPRTAIAAYRLDLLDKVFAKGAPTLYDIWQPVIQCALMDEDWILNLASKEYSDAVANPRMITIEFLECKKGQWKQWSTSSKQMRGRLAHYMVANQCTKLSDLPLTLDGFVRADEVLPALPTASGTIVYRKE